jgi:hypothetical protein
MTRWLLYLIAFNAAFVVGMVLTVLLIEALYRWTR